MKRFRPGLWLAALGALAPSLNAQRPSLSRLLEPALRRDTTVSVWVFAREGRPVDELVRAVAAAGGHLRRRSTWLHAVSADVRTTAIRQLLQNPAVRHIQPIARFRQTPAPPVIAAPMTLPGRAPPARSPQGARQDSLYGPSAMPFHRLNLFPLVDRGFRGTGIKIALLDTGFETLRADFAAAHVIAQRDFVFNDSVVRNQPGDVSDASEHGTSTWSLLAADDPGSIIGIAPDALYILAKTEDIRSETRVEEDNYVAALEWADSLGASIVSSSLGYLCFDDPATHVCDSGSFRYTFAQLNGDVAVTSQAARIAAERGILLVTAMGNDGPASRTLETPADADSIISAGAEDSTGVIAPFSSRGPTADGRIKPDLTAPGVAIFVVDPITGFARSSGTSFSTPILAGAAALLRQIHPALGPIAIRDALRRWGNHASQPDTIVGWGTPDALAAATFPAGVALLVPADTLLTSVTPTVSWAVPDAPAFAPPFQYRLRVSPRAAFDTVTIDTLLTTTAFTFKPLQPGSHVVLDLAATAADSVTTTTRSVAFVAPAWATLLTLNQPAGSTIRDVRPSFQWSSPAADTPPGPFTYTITILRAEDGSVDLSESGVKTTTYVPPRDLERNTPYRWTITSHLGPDSSVTQSLGTFVITSDAAPPVTLLFQNFPNPFPNATTGQRATCFWFDLANAGQVKLDILDLLGHLVRRLIPGSAYGPFLRSGRYGRPLSTDVVGCDPALEWDGTATDGTTVPRGIYLAKLETPDGVFVKRIVFLGPGN